MTHLLNRAAFGPSREDVDELRRVGPEAWLAAQLTPGSDPAIDRRLSGFKTLRLSVAEALAAYPPLQKRLKEMGVTPAQLADEDSKKRLRAMVVENGEELPRQLLVEATQAKLIRVTQSRRQLEEVLVDFWFNHFNVSAEKNRTRWMVTPYERDAIRPFVFGRFRDLLGATAKHPAMLWYLDNWQSVKEGFPPPLKRRPVDDEGALRKRPTGLNENYARELLELHTLGVEAGYSQDDVREAARALTGWSIELQPRRGRMGEFVFRDGTHDTGAKHIFGLALPPGGRQADGEQLLDFLARHPATARHLAKKLCMRFVSDDPPPELVEHVASVFLATDGDLRATVQSLFESPAFWSDAARGAKTKSPLEFVASSVRAVGTLDEVQQPLARPLEAMGEPLYRCNPPTGYAERGAPWISAGALVSRINFGLALATGRIPGVVVELPPRAASADATIDAVALRLLGQRPSPQTRATLLQALSAREEDGETRTLEPAVVAGLLLGSPEFQHR